MHPFGTYLAITTVHREPDWSAPESDPATFARVDATPVREPEPRSRFARLAAMLRRRVLRTAGA
jgi:hypothetical protein